ncbi:Dipeptidyl peptidase 8 [Papilio xuthus]|uniref:Dipeptidyl peptidase 8 n=1 Tax=Papilio xuthus TaxID=66420 RepID=A0A0N1IN93_PAPXU|nr:Dipeptidyl peptidase 8 [Papilio xuthus]
MGLPARAPHAYSRASVLAHAPFFPEREGRLLIIHGLADENVHFCHTAALLAELVRLGKPHRVQVSVHQQITMFLYYPPEFADIARRTVDIPNCSCLSLIVRGRIDKLCP